jgi:choline kinase
MLEVGGGTLIDRQLDALERGGVRHVTVVVGCHEQRLREHLGNRVTYVRNERYRETGSLYSLWLAASHLQGGAFVIDADVAFTPLLLDRLKWHPAPDALLFDRRRSLGPEEMKVRLAGPYVVDIGKQIAASVAAGASVGFLKFGEEGASRLVEILGELMAAGEAGAGAPRAVVALAHRWPVVGIESDGLAWTEVDYPDDLEYANRVIPPAIDASFLPPTITAPGVRPVPPRSRAPHRTGIGETRGWQRQPRVTGEPDAWRS